MRVFICVSVGMVMTLFTGGRWAELAAPFTGLVRCDAAPSGRPPGGHALDSRAGRLEVARKDKSYRVRLRDEKDGERNTPGAVPGSN